MTLLLLLHYCLLYRALQGERLDYTAEGVLYVSILHVLTFNKVLFFIYLQINNQRTQSDRPLQLRRPAWLHAAFPLSIFSSINDQIDEINIIDYRPLWHFSATFGVQQIRLASKCLISEVNLLQPHINKNHRKKDSRD